VAISRLEQTTTLNAHRLLENARRSTRRRRADTLTYLDDLDHDLTIVEVRTGSNNASILEAMHRLIILERKMLKINTAINKYILHKAVRLDTRGAATAGEGWVLILIVSMSFVVMAVRGDLCK
jgi:hypothetical protein